MATQPRIDVCIATYRRPALLAGLLRSLQEQRTDDRFSIAAHVVDNDPTCSAESTVRAAEGAGLAVDYDVQPIKNISLTRNRSVAMARGDFVAFIDDDEHASPRWLLEHLEALERLGADLAHGPVEPLFAAGVPGYVQRGGVFNTRPVETGATKGFIPSTNNCLARREVIDRHPSGFDPSYGISGGEDSEFFARVAAAGARSIWCREAVVFEHVPRERATLRWIVRRKFRSGNVYARRLLESDPRQLRRQLRARIRRFTRSLVGVPVRAMGIPRDPRPFFAELHELVFNAGVFAHCIAGVVYDEYR